MVFSRGGKQEEQIIGLDMTKLRCLERASGDRPTSDLTSDHVDEIDQGRNLIPTDIEFSQDY